MERLAIGVVGTSRKQSEQRVPIHPDHLPRIKEEVRRKLVFEEGYGAPFGIADSEIANLTGGVRPRKELLGNQDAVIVTKPLLADLEEMREGGILWGLCALRPTTRHHAGCD